MPSLINARSALAGRERSAERRLSVAACACHYCAPAEGGLGVAACPCHYCAPANVAGGNEPGQRPAGLSLLRCAKDQPIWAQECLSTPRMPRKLGSWWCAATASRNSTTKALSESS